MNILDTTPLLTCEVSVNHAASEVRLWSLWLVQGIGTKLETKHVNKHSLDKRSLS